eukprot:GHVQ01008527.1.p1 GENE.GHVQ01008527.1~~GHVQ01008527.1.p1  ORF type:complete len:257 (+),score=60.14 GHVQ01008527.1:319-1089(+)
MDPTSSPVDSLSTIDKKTPDIVTKSHSIPPTTKSNAISPTTITLNDKVTKLIIRPMQIDDYEDVLSLLPKVSTCSLKHNVEQLQFILSIPTYHPFCVYVIDRQKNTSSASTGSPSSSSSSSYPAACTTTTTNGTVGGCDSKEDTNNGTTIGYVDHGGGAEDDMLHGQLELIGFAELYRLPHLGRNFDGRLERVITREEYRGKGIATKLCEYIVDIAKTKLDCGRVDLTVEKGDARHVYQDKLQFSPVETTVLRKKF